ncbi:MAG TPA: hypothetical protein PLD86_10180 [Vicinamibacteria bacterium]|nr:hypothetical protein [Vicinamibacteria bacterium]
MKIVRDQPPDLLGLESPRANLPRATVLTVVGFVAGVIVLVAMVPPVLMIAGGGVNVDGLISDLPWLLLLAPLTLIGPVLLYQRLRGHFIAVVKLRVDRRAGEIEMETENPLFTRPMTIQSKDVVRLVAGSASVRPHWRLTRAGRNPLVPGVRLTVWWRAGARTRSRSVTFPVEDVNKREEVADLGYRMGRASGLLHSRVLRSDERDIEVEVTRDRVAGSEPLPEFEGPADYARDIVAPQALRAVSVETMPAFVPKEFRSRSRVSVWEPRREVRFHRPAGLIAIGCMPFTLLVLTGPLLLLTPASPGNLSGKLIISAVLGLAGLFFGWLASEFVSAEAGRTVKLDWAGNRLKIRGAFLGKAHALSDVLELELRSVPQTVRVGRNGSYLAHSCQVLAHLRPGAVPKDAPLLLVETESFREDPDTPYRQALPLATELAEALNVPRRVTAAPQ